MRRYIKGFPFRHHLLNDSHGIAVFTEFDKYFKSTPISYFERATKQLKIETTYRFDNNLKDLTSEFILKNPKQIKKELKTKKIKVLMPCTIYYYNDSVNTKSQISFHPVEIALNDISIRASFQFNKKIPEILLLGRYNHDLQMLKNYSDKFLLRYDGDNEVYKVIYKEKPELDIKFLTVHSAKGLEGDYVIILNCNSGISAI